LSRNAHCIDDDSAGGYIEHVVIAEFHEDSYMAGQILNRKAVIAMTKDTDIPIIAGGGCMAINEFTKNKFRIVSTSRSTLEDAMTLLPDKSDAKLKPVENALFDGLINPKLRALMMVILGCNTYHSGMVGVSVKTLSKMISAVKTDLGHSFTEELLFDLLHRQFMKKMHSPLKQSTHILMLLFMSQQMYHPALTSQIPMNQRKELLIWQTLVFAKVP